MKPSSFAVILGAACLLAACNGNSGALDASRFENPVFGTSVRNNIAVQSVPADPAKLGAPVRADGARQSLAQARYETDRVKPVLFGLPEAQVAASHPFSQRAPSRLSLFIRRKRSLI